MIKNPNIEPQLCVQGKKEDLLNINHNFIAQEKFDGHRAIMYVKDGKNNFYSRRTSDVTGNKEDNTERLPYLRDCFINGTEDCIFDGELVIVGDSDSSKVQQILGSTPERAKELWESGVHLIYKIFDVIKWHGEFVDKYPLTYRMTYLSNLKNLIGVSEYFDIPFFYIDNQALDFTGLHNIVLTCDSYDLLLDKCYELGREGIVIKDLNSTYDFKRNVKWKKFKKVNTADLVIMGYIAPEKAYTGKFSVKELRERGWEYWEDGEPVSKTYAKGWVAGIVCGAYIDKDLKKVCVVKGFSDEIQELIKHKQLGTTVVEVAYQGIINPNTKSLRHPRVNCFRYDKKEEDCLWENI